MSSYMQLNTVTHPYNLPNYVRAINNMSIIRPIIGPSNARICMCAFEGPMIGGGQSSAYWHEGELKSKEGNLF